MTEKERETLIQEGRNQVPYLLLGLGDENVAHDNWHPDRAKHSRGGQAGNREEVKAPEPVAKGMAGL